MEEITLEIVKLYGKISLTEILKKIKKYDLIHSLWIVNLVKSLPTTINIAIALLDISQLFEALNEVVFTNITIPSSHSDSTSLKSPFDFLKDIIQIVKVVGNEMNKGYIHKQNMDKFALNILPEIFKINSVEAIDNICLFDIVLSTYLKYKGLELTSEVSNVIIDDCEKVSQYLTCLSGNSNNLVALLVKKKGDVEKMLERKDLTKDCYQKFVNKVKESVEDIESKFNENEYFK